MLIATIITYNDFPLIKDCIESIVDKIDRIIAIDGKYKDFPGDVSNSTDGTLEYLCSIDKADVISTINYSEIEKRNKYLEDLKDGDTVLNLDADEVLIGDIPELKADFGVLNLHDMVGKHVQNRASRFFKYHKNMQYKNVHYTLYADDIMINNLLKVVNPNFTSEHITSCYIEHYWNKRDDLRKYNKGLYYKKLVQAESKFPK
jgi:hypothetical protein